MAFEDPRAANVHRRKPMFDLSRIGFDGILLPSAKNAALIALAEETLEAESEEEEGEGVGRYIGVHLRRCVFGKLAVVTELMICAEGIVIR